LYVQGPSPPPVPLAFTSPLGEPEHCPKTRAPPSPVLVHACADAKVIQGKTGPTGKARYRLVLQDGQFYATVMPSTQVGGVGVC